MIPNKFLHLTKPLITPLAGARAAHATLEGEPSPDREDN